MAHLKTIKANPLTMAALAVYMGNVDLYDQIRHEWKFSEKLYIGISETCAITSVAIPRKIKFRDSKLFIPKAPYLQYEYSSLLRAPRTGVPETEQVTFKQGVIYEVDREEFVERLRKEYI